MITAEHLRELLNYDPATGVFIWKERRKGVRVGAVAGSIYSTGYRAIKIDQRHYLAHRLAWLYVRGEWPIVDIDHINRQRADNRITNLRPATRSQNQANVPIWRTSSSGYRGVTRRRSGRWGAGINAHGRRIELGTFGTPEEASAAYRAAAVAHYGKFAHG
jgi:hypothetical protein